MSTQVRVNLEDVTGSSLEALRPKTGPRATWQICVAKSKLAIVRVLKLVLTSFYFLLIILLNQVRTGLWSARAWFLKIAFVCKVGMHMCICVCVCSRH